MSQLALSLPNNYKIDDNLTGGVRGVSGLTLNLANPANIINAFISIFFIIAGLVLFGMLIGGGFTIFLSTGNPEKIKQGTAMITNALVGFLIMFAAYWIIQLVEFSLGVKLI